MKKFWTTGTIAVETNAGRDEVNYAIRKAGIKPIGRAGIVRLFPASAVPAVRQFLEARRRKENHDASRTS